MADKHVEPPQRNERQIAEEAARWFEALKTAGPGEQTEFAAWLRQSPRHVHYFLHTTALDGLLENVDPDKQYDVPKLVGDITDNIVSLPLATSSVPKTLFNRPWNTVKTKRRIAAASVLFICAAWLAAAYPWGWNELATGDSEQHSVELEDGSIVHLNVASRVMVRLTAGTRELKLVEGEALFTVHQDATRPFRVHVDDKVIQALGTEFNVYRREHTTKISVLEGAVRISSGRDSNAVAAVVPTSLSAGEEAQIELNGQVHSQRVPDVASAAAWRERRLMFRADSLDDVVAEFNRYNQSPKIRLEDLDGKSRHYTGSFDAHDPNAFAAVLAEEASLAVEKRGDEIVIRAR